MPAAMASCVEISRVSVRSSGTPNSSCRSNSPPCPANLSTWSRSVISSITAPASLFTRRVTCFSSMDWRTSSESDSIRISPFKMLWMFSSENTCPFFPGSPNPAPLMTTDPVIAPGRISALLAVTDEITCGTAWVASAGDCVARGIPAAYIPHNASLKLDLPPLRGWFVGMIVTPSTSFRLSPASALSTRLGPHSINIRAPFS